MKVPALQFLRERSRMSTTGRNYRSKLNGTWFPSCWPTTTLSKSTEISRWEADTNNSWKITTMAIWLWCAARKSTRYMVYECQKSTSSRNYFFQGNKYSITSPKSKSICRRYKIMLVLNANDSLYKSWYSRTIKSNGKPYNDCTRSLWASCKSGIGHAPRN